MGTAFLCTPGREDAALYLAHHGLVLEATPIRQPCIIK